MTHRPMRTALSTLAVLVPCFLVGCSNGGGGSGGAPAGAGLSAPGEPAGAPAGLFVATSPTSGRELTAFVRDDSTFWITAAGAHGVGAFVTGQGTASDSGISASAADYFVPNGRGAWNGARVPYTLNGSAGRGLSFGTDAALPPSLLAGEPVRDGSVTAPAAARSVYDYDAPASIASIAGVWISGPDASPTERIAVLPEGEVIGFGIMPHRTLHLRGLYWGALWPRGSGKNVFDLTTYIHPGAPSDNPGAAVYGPGIAFGWQPDSGPRLQMLFGPPASGSRTDVWPLVLRRPAADAGFVLPECPALADASPDGFALGVCRAAQSPLLATARLDRLASSLHEIRRARFVAVNGAGASSGPVTLVDFAARTYAFSLNLPSMPPVSVVLSPAGGERTCRDDIGDRAALWLQAPLAPGAGQPSTWVASLTQAGGGCLGAPARAAAFDTAAKLIDFGLWEHASGGQAVHRGGWYAVRGGTPLAPAGALAFVGRDHATAPPAGTVVGIGPHVAALRTLTSVRASVGPLALGPAAADGSRALSAEIVDLRYFATNSGEPVAAASAMPGPLAIRATVAADGSVSGSLHAPDASGAPGLNLGGVYGRIVQTAAGTAALEGGYNAQPSGFGSARILPAEPGGVMVGQVETTVSGAWQISGSVGPTAFTPNGNGGTIEGVLTNIIASRGGVTAEPDLQLTRPIGFTATVDPNGRLRGTLNGTGQLAGRVDAALTGTIEGVIVSGAGRTELVARFQAELRAPGAPTPGARLAGAFATSR